MTRFAEDSTSGDAAHLRELSGSRVRIPLTWAVEGLEGGLGLRRITGAYVHGGVECRL